MSNNLYCQAVCMYVTLKTGNHLKPIRLVRISFNNAFSWVLVLISQYQNSLKNAWKRLQLMERYLHLFSIFTEIDQLRFLHVQSCQTRTFLWDRHWLKAVMVPQGFALYVFKEVWISKRWLCKKKKVFWNSKRYDSLPCGNKNMHIFKNIFLL